jgi:hypothetical protein
MKIKMVKNAFSPEYSLEADKEYEVSEEVAKALIDAEAAILIEGEFEKPVKKKVK